MKGWASLPIDVAGIGALLSLQAAGIYLRLVSPTEPVREVLRLTGLEAMFEIGEAEKGDELLVPRVLAHEHLPDGPVAIPR